MDNMREKLVELMKGYCDNAGDIDCHYTCANCLADHLIEHGVTVQEWRPASDPPKEDCKDVLVYFEYFRHGEYNRLFRTIGIGYAWEGEWSAFVNGQSGWRQLKILAWMPLPEEPKGR